MDEKFHKPLDAGQRVRRKSRWHFICEKAQRILRSRFFLLTVLWVAKATVKLVRFVSIFGDS